MSKIACSGSCGQQGYLGARTKHDTSLGLPTKLEPEPMSHIGFYTHKCIVWFVSIAKWLVCRKQSPALVCMSSACWLSSSSLQLQPQISSSTCLVTSRLQSQLAQVSHVCAVHALCSRSLALESVAQQLCACTIIVSRTRPNVQGPRLSPCSIQTV